MSKKKKKVSEITRYFLPCHLKPTNDKNSLWHLIEGFSYDLSVSYIHGTLGITSYEPREYSILELDEDLPPMLGWSLTITEPVTIKLLYALKGFTNYDSFCVHQKRLVKVYQDSDEYEDCWCFKLNNDIVEKFSSIERIEFGAWDDKDEKQIELLEKINGKKERDY